MAVELRHLRYFVAVAEEGHVTRAAERLGIQQPPLSLQIRALERELGAQLFHRKPRGMELTEAGQALFGETTAILERLERAIDGTRRVARGEQGSLCIGVAPTAPFHPFVPRAIRAFREKYPGISLAIEEGLSNEVAERLGEDRMDVAFVRVSRLAADNLVVAPLLDEKLIAALPAKHPLAKGRRDATIPLGRLSKEAFIVYGPPGTGLHDETLEACRAAGFTPQVVQRAPRITTTLGFVAAGMGVALVPESIRNAAVDGIAYRALGGEVRPNAVLALASRRHDSSPVVRNFIDLVKAERARARS
jgi:DNA-binding transcriptional LysR family regulator